MKHHQSTPALAALVISTIAAAPIAHAQNVDPVKAAQAYRKNQPVKPMNETTVVAEGEEFRITPITRSFPEGLGGWKAQPWGANYYAATFANSFLNRKAFIGAPEQADNSAATIEVEVPKAGRYLALVRYEAAPNFQTQFRVQVSQNNQNKLDRLYGARENLKIWAFREKLKTEVSWSWGAVENVVWEGHDAFVDLDAGRATIRLVAGKQPEPAAKRNVDLVMLTSDIEDVNKRIETENYLPLDGMLTQEGDVYLKLHNHAAGPMTLTVPNGQEHSPYWVHNRTWKPKTVQATAGQSTDWVEVGSQLDSLNDGQWTLTATKPKDSTAPLNYSLEFGVRNANGQIETINRFPNLSGNAELAYHADTRYSRLIRSSEDVLYDLVNYLKKQPVHGKPPQRTLIYGYTFDPRPGNAKYSAARAEFIRLIGATGLLNITDEGSLAHKATAADKELARGYIDLRGKSPKELEEWGKKQQAEGTADKFAVVSLGDEIGLAAPPANDQAGFHAWLRQQGLKASDVDAAAGDDWSKVTYSIGKETMQAKPSLYYYSKRYQHHFGIQAQKELTDVLRKYLPNAGIGANFSPHHAAPYIGEVHQWVSLFRAGGMTMPWSEDYIWQLPVGSQQMNYMLVDMFRAGIKGKPEAKIHMYVMPHWPGNTVNSFRRQWYGVLGHGAKVLNLFEFRPVQVAYTENHVSLPEMFQEVRRGIHELGTFEDIIQDGHVRPAQTALWFSETGDIWNNNRHPFDTAKRTLYVALKHQQLPLDFVVEEDALAGDLKNYKVLYLTDPNVSRAASKAIADWVKAGGTLFATAGAGMFDEFNAPNTAMRTLLGVEQQELVEGTDPIRWAKQDLPFAKPIDTVTWKSPNGEVQMPSLGARSKFTLKGGQIAATFADGSPAVVSNTVGIGAVTYVGFLPGLSYFKPAIPLKPVDRGSTDDAMAHFIPTEFDKGASALIGLPARGIERPVTTSEPLVEASIIEAKQGRVISLVNWSGKPVKNLSVTVLGQEAKDVKLASGNKVNTMRKDAAGPIYTFDLAVADALILR